MDYHVHAECIRIEWPHLDDGHRHIYTCHTREHACPNILLILQIVNVFVFVLSAHLSLGMEIAVGIVNLFIGCKSILLLLAYVYAFEMDVVCSLVLMLKMEKQGKGKERDRRYWHAEAETHAVQLKENQPK